MVSLGLENRAAVTGGENVLRMSAWGGQGGQCYHPLLSPSSSQGPSMGATEVPIPLPPHPMNFVS